MLDNSYSITFNATSVTLTKVRENDYTSEYRGEDGQYKFVMSVKHQIVPRGTFGDSHMIRLDVEKYDAEGIYVRTTSYWRVIKTFDNSQDAADCGYAAAALDGLVGASFVTKLITGES